ncbi:VPLPA-CTERM sorting domain-containing protein [Jannaschia sp. W003]|uniref:VPLPA-CTERM sorting domain-containing protein n=1 Tax=Jannaschia sp. W003 TaxID=2867012 RepID=UPI0021A8616D|nr:VPLPA-CTERM sorting domain-containing protein [Jannaschia sp. W003]UWQ23205.1 VPLPA-CTERM sorting domain-containing protein [Jannaschia sp. W003]
MSFRINLAGLALAASATLGFASTADASHGRGAAMVPSVSANGVLTLDMVSFWRQGTTVCSFPSDCISASVTGPSGFQGGVGGGVGANSGGESLDNADSRRSEVRQVDTLQLTQGAGLYTIDFSGCCWVGGVEGLNSSSYGTRSTIFWDGQTANAPILFDLENIQQEVVRGQNYSDNVDATSGNGLALSYAATTASGLTGVASGPDTYSIDANGTITIAAGDQALGTGTYDINDNNFEPGADHAFEGTIANADGSSIEFYWVFDGVEDDGTNNLAPQVDDLVVTVVAGTTLNQVITATDPNSGDTLTLDLISFDGAGGTFPGGLSGASPLSGNFSWDSTGTSAGDSFLALFEASDGSLTDRGSLRINVIAGGGTSPVPLPAAGFLLLGGIASLGGLGAMRRRSKPKA